MSGKSINFDDKKIEKSDFYENKKIFSIDGIDINKIFVSKKEPYGTKKGLKYFIGYNDDNVIRPLCLRLSQITGYVKKFENDTKMSLSINDKQLLKNYNKILEKIENLMSIEFETKPVYDDKYIKARIKIYMKKI